jgi:hypothetical protein
MQNIGAYIHTCIHTYMRTYVYTYNTYVYTYIHTQTGTCIHTYIHTYPNMSLISPGWPIKHTKRIEAYIHTCIHTYHDIGWRAISKLARNMVKYLTTSRTHSGDLAPVASRMAFLPSRSHKEQTQTQTQTQT